MKNGNVFKGSDKEKLSREVEEKKLSIFRSHNFDELQWK
jgi:hypothetical protein